MKVGGAFVYICENMAVHAKPCLSQVNDRQNLSVTMTGNFGQILLYIQ